MMTTKLARLFLTTVFATLLFFVALIVACRPAWAGVKERHEAYDRSLSVELGKLAPDAVPLFAEANQIRSAEPAKALALYERVSDLAPSFTPAIRRRAQLLAETGRRADGIALARRAVGMTSSVENKMTLALVLSHGLPGERPDVPQLDEAVSLMRQTSVSAPNDIEVQLALCEVLVAAQRVDDLRTAAAFAVQIAPDEPEPHIYAALASAMHGDRDSAYASIENARRLGIDPKVADRLTSAVDASEPALFRWGKRLIVVVVLWILGLLGLFASGVVLSKMTLRLVKRLSSDRDQAIRGGALLRTIYRAVLHAASLYYYASLPFVLLLAVAGGGGIIFGFLYIGRIPIYVVAITGTLVLVTISSVVKSLLVRSREVDPGVSVDLDKHVRLRKVIAEVADRVGTRAVDEVYLTPNAGIAVLERGSMLRQLRGNTERCLVLGVGVLDGMKLGPFKAILAHEYGHFSNRDTAGGGVALSVRRSLVHTAVSLVRGGGAVWYSPMWQFLIWFQRIFLRISQGASRLQEVMADRIAAFSYGPDAFVAGLDHVVRRSIALDAHLDATLTEVVDKGSVLANVYTYKPEKMVDAKEFEDAVKTALEEEPSPYDSHPRPVDRIAWVRHLSFEKNISQSADADIDAWSLFASREEIEERMTSELRANLAESGILVAGAPASD